MALTPSQAPEILVHNRQPDAQAENAIERTAEVSLPRQVEVGDHTEEIRNLKLAVAKANLRVDGLKQLRTDDNKKVLNPNWEDIERELWLERASNPKTNLWINGVFINWDSATVPNGYTIGGAPTISQQTVRPGGDANHKACRIVAGGAAGSVSRTFSCRASAKYKVAGWVKMAASAVVTITLTTDGGTPVVVTSPPILTAAIQGTDWLSFPRPMLDIIDIETPSDATTITVKLEVDANHTADFSDFQLVRGPRCDADLVENAPEDIQSAPGLNLPTSDTYTPTGTGVANITTVTPGLFTYFRIGNVVRAQGPVVVDPAAAGAATWRISLPVASNIGAASDASGNLTVGNGGATGIAGDVIGAAATDDVLCGYICPDGNQRTVQVGFQYRVI